LPANYFIGNQKEKPADTILALNKSVESYAKANDIPYVDYYSAMVDDQRATSVYSNDGVHPNKAGYQLMEPIVERIIALYV
jgi:lysophospholipase L1-like esterase